MSENGGGGSLVSVGLAGPWWTELTYRTDCPALRPGVRVTVPVGAGTRVGLVLGPGSGYGGDIREVSGVLDDAPVLRPFVLPLLRWFCEAYLCGIGTAMKTLLPAEFLKGEPFQGGLSATTAAGPKKSSADFVYEPDDEVRFGRYAEIVADGKPSLLCCPTHESAKRLYGFLKTSPEIPEGLREKIFLYPRSGAKAEWRGWSRTASGDVAVVVGAQASAMAPLYGIARIAVEDESSNVWRTMRPPVYNVRSLLSMRARIEGAELILGGRMSSSRAFMHIEKNIAQLGKKLNKKNEPAKGKKFFFVDLKLAYSPSVKGVSDAIAVSEPLVRETDRAIQSGAWAMWILDRKGYAGEIVCEECGLGLRCRKCGGTMRWEFFRDSRGEDSRVRCIVCGYGENVPERCPNCGGVLLTAKRPGLDALPTLARAALSGVLKIILSAGDAADEIGSSEPGLVIGTRAALEYLDVAKFGLVGWLDADGEARSQEYDARARAFGLIWESAWRGVAPEARSVLLQTRRPGREWQKGLEDPNNGWKIFWRRELDERREFGMPPFLSLVKIELAKSDSGVVVKKLIDSDFEFWESDEPDSKKNIIWVRTKKLSELRKILEPLFQISRAKRGFPQTTVWHE